MYFNISIYKYFFLVMVSILLLTPCISNASPGTPENVQVFGQYDKIRLIWQKPSTNSFVKYYIISRAIYTGQHTERGFVVVNGNYRYQELTYTEPYPTNGMTDYYIYEITAVSDSGRSVPVRSRAIYRY